MEAMSTLLVINNEKIRRCGDLRFLKHSQLMMLATAAKGIAEIITVHGYINVDSG